MPIQLLAPEVAAKIAAGEVVERPASVVKELVENALDAGATRITVEVRGGGVESIRVTDNGCGIPPDEVELAFHRYATSKLTDAQDLEAVSTLGFRGEALASIAAVAIVSLVTRPPGPGSGQQLTLRWGEVVSSGPQGAPQGTTVHVQDLFFNVPARRKFLRSPATESARISDLVSRFALAFPEVQFQLSVDRRLVLASPGRGDVREALAAVYGAEVAQGMLQVTWEDNPPEGSYRVQGLVSPPSLSRANRSYITLLVNRRWVSSRSLTYALEQAYQGFLQEGRYPLAVLDLRIPYPEVDVNVHPTKREVRFRREDRVFATLQRAVRGTLVSYSPVPHVQTGRPLAPEQPALSPFASDPEAPSHPGEATPVAAPRLEEAVPLLRVLGQASTLYVVAEGPNGVYLIDQHAAHEQVLYEQVMEGVRARVPQVQPLLEPVPVELTAAQAQLVQEHWQLLADSGFQLEPFGERAYLLRGVPGVVKGPSPERALPEVLDLLAGEGRLAEQQEALVASIACHSAVRAGMALSHQEMVELVRQLEKAAQPHTCPHGRPTMVHLSSRHLERQFGRR
ncbi:MAG: DNA mismatch repair endonuclease MutL [Dehalococcoidia bacterium]